MWYQIELPAPGTIRSIEMNATGNEESFAPFFLVQISNDGQFWSEPIVTTTGELQARVHFGEPVTTKFIRITINKKSGWQTWAINNLELYGIEN
jgi:hypothetical protein